MRISDWSSDVCSSDLPLVVIHGTARPGDQRLSHRIEPGLAGMRGKLNAVVEIGIGEREHRLSGLAHLVHGRADFLQVHKAPAHEARKAEHDGLPPVVLRGKEQHARSEEHTSELQSLMRISYAVFCLN